MKRVVISVICLLLCTLASVGASSSMFSPSPMLKDKSAPFGVPRGGSARSGGELMETPRGGAACEDTHMSLFLKISTSAAVETALMYKLAKFAASVGERGYSKVSARLLRTAALVLIIFGSASFGSLIDGGLSAASRQVLAPNEIAGDADWYDKLEKPSWNPPGWLFPIMWLIVSKPTQLVGVWKLITSVSDAETSLPLLVYCLHLSLGDAWNKVFFGLQCTGRGLVVISSFWTALLTSVYLFYQADSTAGLFLVPTFPVGQRWRLR
ncbi:hypothetical protein THAOC_33741 [Thalassiosira oceanica]|uniref:Uncharacterized protein n=1 Tax=Thalassiosira oceanica TaxID=159749 RepID=K0R4L0_THAOC|nr:hypothetical protein THAOC_33741 [Thalassiosira oceanica]|eukprot:EJK47530.1 hypothetical protein THAOC_33741 [Thalassiosira oceanica]